METTLRHRELRFFTLALLLGVPVIFIIIFLNANPAYAIGLVRVSSNEFLDIKFISARTDDQGTSLDPGQSVHIGQCTAAIKDKRAEFRVYNGYPAYHCTLSIGLKNLSEKTVRLQRVETMIPKELVITQPDLTGDLILQPQEEGSLDFILALDQNAEENEKYRFSVRLIFEDFNSHARQ